MPTSPSESAPEVQPAGQEARIGQVCYPLGGCVGAHFLRQQTELAALTRQVAAVKALCDEAENEARAAAKREGRVVWDFSTVPTYRVRAALESRLG